jgi:hypothetical protein
MRILETVRFGVSLKRRRAHPRTWLSSHKLGRPFGLAGLWPVGID